MSHIIGTLQASIVPRLSRVIASGFLYLLAAMLVMRGCEFLSRLFLARILSVSTFGDIQLLTSAFEIAIVVVGFGISASIVTFCAGTEDREERLEIFHKCILYGTITSICASIAIFVIALILADMSSLISHFRILALILPIAVIFNASGGFLLSFFQSEKKVKEISIYKIAFGVGMALLLCIGASLGSEVGYVYALALTYIVAAGACIKIFPSKPKDVINSRIKRADILKFSTFSYFSNIVSFTSAYVDIFMIQYLLKDSSLVGQYGAALLLAKGLWILPLAGSQIALPYLSGLKEAVASLRHRYYQLLIGTAVSMLFICASFFVAGEPLIIYLFSDRYVQAVEAFKILLVTTFFYSIALVPSVSLLAVGDSKVNFIISVACFVVVLGLSFVLIPRLGISGAAWAAAAGSATRFLFAHPAFCARFREHK